MKNKFLKKIQLFIRKNAYALVVSTCVLLAITILGVATFSQGTNTKQDIVVNNPDVPGENIPTGSDDIISFVMPIKDGEIYKEYAENHLLEDKTTGFWQAHLAIDFKATEGTKVLAACDGVVEKIENSMMDGLTITIKHADNLKTVYKCLSDNFVAVKKGDKVKKGEKIGVVGQSLKEKADGAHLHFEVIENDKKIDPLTYLEDVDAK